MWGKSVHPVRRGRRNRGEDPDPVFAAAFRLSKKAPETGMSKCPRARHALRTLRVRRCLSPSANTCAKGTWRIQERAWLCASTAMLFPVYAHASHVLASGKRANRKMDSHLRDCPSWRRYFVTYGATLPGVSSCAIECRSARKIREFTLWQVSSCAFFFRHFFKNCVKNRVRSKPSRHPC